MVSIKRFCEWIGITVSHESDETEISISGTALFVIFVLAVLGMVAILRAT